MIKRKIRRPIQATLAFTDYGYMSIRSRSGRPTSDGRTTTCQRSGDPLPIVGKGGLRTVGLGSSDRRNGSSDCRKGVSDSRNGSSDCCKSLFQQSEHPLPIVGHPPVGNLCLNVTNSNVTEWDRHVLPQIQATTTANRNADPNWPHRPNHQ